MAASASTESTVLRSLRHLRPVSKYAKYSSGSPKPRSATFVKPKDRIPFWNIVPGDHVKLTVGNVARQYGLNPKIKVRGEGRVVSIDRERNTVRLANLDPKYPLIPFNVVHVVPRLQDPDKPELGFTPTTRHSSRPVHYSNLALKVPDLENVYARRIIKKNVHYHNVSKMWRWRRFAVVRNPDGTNGQIEIPWPKTRQTAPETRSDATGRRDVEEETWLPWAPSDPVHLIPKPPRRSANSILDVARRLAQMQAARRANALTAAPTTLYTGISEGRYPGFQKKPNHKPPPIPQDATAAEVLDLAKQSMARWAAAQRNHVAHGGRSFAAEDYLSLAPLVGPAAGGSWQLPIADELIGTEPFERDPSTGLLLSVKEQQGLTSKIHLDSMPLELLLKDELTNERGRAHRQRRWQARLARKAAVSQKVGERQQILTTNLRKYLAEKRAVSTAEADAVTMRQYALANGQMVPPSPSPSTLSDGGAGT